MTWLILAESVSNIELNDIKSHLVMHLSCVIYIYHICVTQFFSERNYPAKTEQAVHIFVCMVFLQHLRAKYTSFILCRLHQFVKKNTNRFHFLQ